MKFKFIGQEASEFMGFQWFPGTEHDVTDEHAIKKLSGSVLFEAVGGDEPVKNKGGRPKKATVTAESETDGDNADTA